MTLKLTVYFLIFPIIVISQTSKVDYYTKFLKTKKNYISYTTETFHGDSILIKSFSDDFSYFSNGFVEKRTTFPENGIINIKLDSTIYSQKKTNEYVVKSYTQGELCYTYKTKNNRGVIKRYTNNKLESVSKYHAKDSSWTFVNKNSSKLRQTKSIDTKSSLIVYDYIHDTIDETSIYYKSKMVTDRFEYDSLLQFDSKGDLFSKMICTFNTYGDLSKVQYYDPNEEDPYIRYTTFEYVYDEKGNWIELKETRKNSSSIKWPDKPKTYSDWITLHKRVISY